MASVRRRPRRDGTQGYAVVYRHNGKQTSTSFDDLKSANQFAKQVDKFGADGALAALRADASAVSSMTVEQWLNRHIDHLTGVDPNTIGKYRAYVRNDLTPAFGELPLAALTTEHVARWINAMGEPDEDGYKVRSKTIANKHGFLAGALKAAVAAKRISTNPCLGIRLPRDDDLTEMLCLTREQVAHLLNSVTDFWRPLVEFLVASGARWGEVAALKPGDIDRKAGTVRINKSWKYGSAGYRLGATKTQKSNRTINVPMATLEKLDYSNEWLFVNRDGGPVRIHGFTRRVWAKALERAWPSIDEDGNLAPAMRPRIHDLRHTCASWMMQSGVPTPIVQQHMGHENINTTVAVYGHLDRRSMAAAADAIGAMLD